MQFVDNALRNASLTAEEKYDVAEARIVMAQAYVGMQEAGFAAMHAYGINYMDLPAYKDKSLLTLAGKSDRGRAVELVLEWTERVHGDIAGAIRRKQMRLVK